MKMLESRAEHIFSLMRTFWPDQENAQLNPVDAVKAAREVAGLLYDATTEAGLDVEQAACWLICATESDAAVQLALRAEEDHEILDIEMSKQISRNKWEPVGIVVGLMDREKAHLLFHTQGFEYRERTKRLLSSFLKLMQVVLSKRDPQSLN